MDYEQGFKVDWTAKQRALRKLIVEEQEKKSDIELKKIGVELI